MRHQVISKNPELPQVSTRDSQTQLIFDDGNWRHLKWQMLFYKMGIVDSVETFKQMGHLQYGGSTDLVIMEGVLTLPDGYNGRVIIDVKGANRFAFKGIQESLKPPLEYEIQIQVYMMLHDIPWAIIWFENKDDQSVAEVLVKADPKLQKFMMKRMNYMRRFVLEDAFPKEECRVDNSDRTFRRCPSRVSCPKLPIHVVKGGEILKSHKPRIKDPDYQQYDVLPLKKFKGKLGERGQSSGMLPS
jgi:hypothetical protein